MPHLVNLDQFHDGETGKIVEFSTTDRKILGKLMSLGIIPGASIRLLRRKPGFVVQSGHTKVALDRRLAASIRVEKFR